MNIRSNNRNRRIGCYARVACLIAFLGALMASGIGCDEYSMLYGSSGGGGWYNYGFSDINGDGSSSSFNLNPYTDVGEELNNYLSDSWTTSY